MTHSTRLLNGVVVVATLVACATPARAQSPPTPPKRDSTPTLLPPPASPRPEAVAPRARAAAQVAPSAQETLRATPIAPKLVGAPVDSVRPAIRPAPSPLVDDRASAPPPPAPSAQRQAQRTTEVAPTPDGPPPTGATARCKDGSYLFAPVNDESCRDRGGLVARFAPPPVPPTPPRRP